IIISDISDVKRGILVGARLPGVSVSRTANLVYGSRATVSKVMTVYTNWNLSLWENVLCFQEDNASVLTSRCVQTGLHGHDDEVVHLTWCPQSPELNII
ncbi:hypothetical protein TNCV_3320871, partial [Trichonephila clavipes]